MTKLGWDGLNEGRSMCQTDRRRVAGEIRLGMLGPRIAFQRDYLSHHLVSTAGTQLGTRAFATYNVI
jgi:hypothetical protein